MTEYHKINTIWKRDDRGRVMPGDYAQEEFAYLKDNRWIGTEKFDGTNIRVIWDGTNVRFGGKTDAAQLPAKLVAYLQDTFVPAMFTTPLCLYGEGIGANIQKGGGNYSPDQRFVLFDVLVDGWWLKRDAIEDIATTLKVPVAPVIFEGTLSDAWERMSKPEPSSWGTANIEGLVLLPATPLRTRRGDRVISKIKRVDWARWEAQ